MLLLRKMILTAFRRGLANLPAWQERTLQGMSCDAYGKTPKRCSDRSYVSRICDVAFSNRPVGVKRFQATHRCNVDVTHGLALRFGIGTKALPSWDPRMRWNNLMDGLAVRRTAGPRHANSPHPSSREGHLSTAGWSSSFLLSDLNFITVLMLLPRLVPGSSRTRCHQPTYGA